MSKETLSQAAIDTAIRKGQEEVVNALMQIDSIKQHIKDVANHIAEEYDYDKKLFLAVSKVRYKSNIEELKTKNDKIVEEYESLYSK
jgi:DNA repair ATPase RecN